MGVALIPYDGFGLLDQKFLFAQPKLKIAVLPYPNQIGLQSYQILGEREWIGNA